MPKRIVICADGTWNRPEVDKEKDFPTNVLKIARAIKPKASNTIEQQVYYDWGVGSYYKKVIGGGTGLGLHKNIMDCYRYIVQNFSVGDELYFFGFSRGAYTVRSLCGLINNCGILKRPDARLIQEAFDHYKRVSKAYSPSAPKSVKFRARYSHDRDVCPITFVGVWDTVGAMGIPFSFLGLFDSKDEFYDKELGPIVKVARHALAIDERRTDFEPTIWNNETHPDLKQVWFAGVHTDLGGGYAPNKVRGQGNVLASDYPLQWMMREATAQGLVFETQLAEGLNPSKKADLHKSRRHIYKRNKPLDRPIDHKKGNILIHQSVKERWDYTGKEYRPKKLEEYIDALPNGWSDAKIEF